MAIPTGLAAQLGIAAEITYGTPVTVTRFYEFTGESMRMEIERLESAGLRAGTRVLLSDRWVAGGKTISGDINMELANKSFGLWFTHMLGGAAVTTSATGVYLHTFTPSDLPVGLTVQIGRPNTSGTVEPFTYHGCKVASWEIGCAVGEIARLRVSLIGEDEATGVPLATASYPSSLTLLTFKEGTLTVAGSSACVTAATVAGNNGLKADRRCLGSQTILAPVEADFREYTADLTTRFTALTDYARFVAGTEADVVLTFTGATITTGHSYTLTITGNARFDGETPNVAGPDELVQPLRCKLVGATPATALTITYKTSDATA